MFCTNMLVMAKLGFIQKPTTLHREGEKPSKYCTLIIALPNRGNRTRSNCAASQCSIHYSIASLLLMFLPTKSLLPLIVVRRQDKECHASSNHEARAHRCEGQDVSASLVEGATDAGADDQAEAEARLHRSKHRCDLFSQLKI